MSQNIPYVQSLAAADKQAGFDYQFYVFLLKVLEIEPNQVLGYEQQDDVHIDFNGTITFIQVKHTIATNTSGKRPNLTQKDTDLWKTISNWTNIINDVNSGRSTESNQIKFLENCEFVLFSNKSFPDNNDVINLFEKCNTSVKTIAEVRTGLMDLIKETDSENLSDADNLINHFLEQSDLWLTSFISKVSFTLDIDNIIILLKHKIKDRFMINSDEQSQDVFNCLFTNLKTDIYNHVSAGNRSISYDYAQLKGFASQCLYQINKPIIRTYQALELPENLGDQVFIKQLVDIGDVHVGDMETIVNYTRFKVLMAQNMKDWEQNHELLPTSKKLFIESCILKWKNIHTKHHRSAFNGTMTEDKLREAAIACLDEIRLVDLEVSDVSLDSMLSNGQFYGLSDNLEIGWAHDWKTKYPVNE